MRWCFWLALLPIALCAQANERPPPQTMKTPEEIGQELAEATQQFQNAEELFNPYYTGPLITPSAAMIPPGQVMWQPYVYVADYYAKFDKDRSSVSLPSSLVQLHLQPVVVQVGITDTVDTLIIWGGKLNWQDGQFGGGIDDVTAGLGWLIQPQGLYVPQVKFTIQETFPVGKYQNLTTNGLGLDGTGGGVFTTTFGFTTAKILFWNTQHPVNSRLFIGYAISTPGTVKNFNSYGGGFGTRGKVHPGNSLTVDAGIEFSVTQNWVIATDIVYNATNETTFHGNPGTTSKGGLIPAGVGTGYSDNLSLAPAIEYNWSDSAGCIGGAWFSVYGRNSLNFAQAILSVYAVFP